MHRPLQFKQRGHLMSLRHLKREEIEQALQVVDRAWELADGPLVQLDVPPNLQHLDREDWEAVCLVLHQLEYQLSISSVH